MYICLGGSIKENIAYGKPGASDEEIIEAAKNANIHDFIMSLDDGYDTYVGERGTRLSGGQKQRISLQEFSLKILKYLYLMKQHQLLIMKVKDIFKCLLKNFLKTEQLLLLLTD